MTVRSGWMLPYRNALNMSSRSRRCKTASAPCINAYAAVLAQAKQKQDEQARQDSRKEASKAIFDADTLTTELAELLIDRVLVYPDKRIEIAYKIQDIFD